MSTAAGSIQFDIRRVAPPESIFLDTSFIAAATISSLKYHNETKAFLEQAIANETVIAYSSLTELEFWQVCLKLEVERYTGVSRNRANRYLRENPDKIKCFTAGCSKNMKLFLENIKRLNAIGFQMSAVIKNCAAMQKAAIYNLMNYDTLQLATMFYAELDTIAALDKHLETCAGLTAYTIIK